jgi:actin
VHIADVEVLVVDNGSAMMKVGFAGDYEPWAVFPTLVGHPKMDPKMDLKDQKVAYIGDEALVMRDSLTLKYPIQKSIVTNWDDMERIWHHAFYSELHVAPEEHPVILTERHLNPKASRERMTQIMFETFNCPFMYVCTAGILALNASGFYTACVVESGDSVTYILPVYEYHLIPHAVVRLEIGGRHITDYLMQILGEQGLHFSTSAERDAIRDMKEKVCCVALPWSELPPPKSYELPSGQCITLDKERVRAPEVLFKPDLVLDDAIVNVGIHECVLNAIKKCDMTIHKELYRSVLLTGGNTMFEGICERLYQELTALVPSTMTIKVLAPPQGSTRKDAIWVGGSHFASLSTFPDNSINRAEYDVSGPSIIHRLRPLA